jgi:RNAse (barnase) inhibitor barstar
METVSRQLAFPSYFGMNWDGLHDLLTDFSWKPAGGYMIIFTNFTAFKNRLPAEATILIDVLHSSAAYWKDRGTGFYVILSG